MSTPASDLRGSDSREIFSLNDEPETAQIEWGNRLYDGMPSYEQAEVQTRSQDAYNYANAQARAAETVDVSRLEAQAAATRFERESSHERDVYAVQVMAHIGALIRSQNRDQELAR